jgi:hypothetical protein
MNYDDFYEFSFRIETVGVKDVGDFKGVISELKYYFVGWEKQYETSIDVLSGKEIQKKISNKPFTIHQRFAVHSLNVNELNDEQFIPFERVGSDTLHDWLKLSIHPDNLEGMKKDIHLLFNPPIVYYNLSHFNTKPESKQ